MPVRFPEWLLSEISSAAEIRGDSQQNIIRLACETGLAALAKVEYKVGEAVARMAMGEPARADAEPEPQTVRIAKPKAVKPKQDSAVG